MQEDVRWAVKYPDEDFPHRLRAFIDSKFDTIDKAVEVLQISSSTMYRYIPAKRKNQDSNSFIYPGVPFLLKLAGLGCDLHWLITGEGEMERDVNDLVPEWAQRKRETMDVLAKYDLHSPEHLDEALSAAAALTQMSRFISGDVGLSYRVNQEPAETTETSNEEQSAASRGHSKRNRR